MPIIQVHLMEGRSREQKRALVSRITEAVVETLDASPQSVRILIHELQPENYALAGTTAADQPLSARTDRNGNGPSTNGTEAGGLPK